MEPEPYLMPDEMREIEDRAERLGVSKLLLMENAGKAVADFISKMDPAGMSLVIVSGTGNNGGDGLVVARHMAAYGALVKVFLLGSDEEVKTMEASHNLNVIKRMERSVELFRLSDCNFMDKLKGALSGADVIVDAIFGTGIKSRLNEPHASVIGLINSSGAYKVAIDVPSGLDPATGEVSGSAIKADATVTFHCAKKGLLSREDLVGELVVANIGIPPEADWIGST